MSSKNSEAIPPVPVTLNPNGADLRGYSSYESERVLPDTAPYYTPYLGLRARLSQVWINKWTVLLLLVLCRMLLAVKGLDHDITSAKAKALSACTSVENVGSAVASLPHYMSQGVNALTAKGVTEAFHGLMTLLTYIVTGVENIVLFVINVYTQTYICLITLVIGGSLHVAIDMIEQAGALVNSSIAAVTADLSKGVAGFQNDLNSFLSGLGSISGLFGGSSKPPTIDLSSEINALNSIRIDPSQLDGQLQTLDSQIPDFAQVNNLTQSILQAPFDEIKQLINESTASYVFDKSVFPVAQKQSLTFCSDNNDINDFFDGLTNLANKARIIFVVVLIILALLACIPMGYREIRRWKTMQQRAGLVHKQAYEPMDVVYIVSRPYTATAGIKMASRFDTTRRQTLVRWAVAYATSVPALFVLSLGVAGLFSSLCQYILLKSIQTEVPALETQVADFANTVVEALNNASESWANGANSVIAKTNADVNSEVFGWVNTTTTAVNNTLNTVLSDINGVINSTFGGTILYDPVQGVINCLIGLKIASIEKGITWVQEHAHIDIPQFDNNTFSLGAAASLTNSSAAESFLSAPGSASTDEISAAVDDLVSTLNNSIAEEAYIAMALVGIWVFILLIGVTRAIIGMMGRDRSRAEGGTVSYTGDGRPPVSPRVNQDANEGVFPRFGGDDEFSPVTMTEKQGSIPRKTVGIFNKAHVRASSHGELSDKF